MESGKNEKEKEKNRGSSTRNKERKHDDTQKGRRDMICRETRRGKEKDRVGEGAGAD